MQFYKPSPVPPVEVNKTLFTAESLTMSTLCICDIHMLYLGV